MLSMGFIGGAEGIRTPDPLTASYLSTAEGP